MARPNDTSPEAHRTQTEILRSIPPAERLRLAAKASDETRALAESGRTARRADPPDPSRTPR
jgi:hypothetical protein